MSAEYYVQNMKKDLRNVSNAPCLILGLFFSRGSGGAIVLKERDFYSIISSHLFISAALSEAPISFNVTSLTATSVSASRQLPQDVLLYRIAVRGFKLHYRLRSSSALQSSEATTIVLNDSCMSKDVSGLEKYTEYEFQVLTLTGFANSPVSSVKVVRTMEDGKMSLKLS